MQKEIKYTGISTTPSDYNCADGCLSAAVNLVPEDGAIKPILPPTTLFTLEDGQRIMCIHKSNSFLDTPHYIIYNDITGILSWRTQDDDTLQTIDDGNLAAVQIYQTSTVGNTLILLTSEGLHYYLWKAKDNAYKNLGTHLPELSLSFGLKGTMVKQTEFTDDYVDVDNTVLSDDGDSVNALDTNTYGVLGMALSATLDSPEYPNDATCTMISNQVLAKVNKFIQEETVDNGKFIFPFFVRYAYRLFDGSLTMHSAPILLTGCDRVQPMVIAKSFDHTDNGITGFKNAAVIGEVFDLAFYPANQQELLALREWKDIISSVDIFISKPIYTYDQNETVKSHSISNDFGHCVCLDEDMQTSVHKRYDIYDLLCKRHDANSEDSYAFDESSSHFLHFNLPARSADDIADDIRSISQFYLLKSYKVNDFPLTPSRVIVDIDDEYLQSLVNREVMTDDYQSHDTIIATQAFAYNSRINLAGITRMPFQGFSPFTMLQRMNGSPTVSTQAITQFDAISGEQTLCSEASAIAALRDGGLFVFYPDTSASQMTLGGNVLKLTKSDFLNGSLFFSGFDTSYTLAESSQESNSEPIEVANKVYTSEVNNPFYFPLGGINTVGTGKIIGICSAVKALSQGQFGDFPLYAFTTEGVWALELSSTGTYSARQPVTRDVCINADSITQLDSSVIFATDRGIMLIEGSQTVCLTDILMGDSFLPAASLPDIDKVAALAGFTLADISHMPFIDFIKASRSIYDYTHQRIIFYYPDNTACTYAYAYSLKSKEWGMMQSAVAYDVNSYPDAIAALSDGSIVNFSLADGDCYNNLLVSRPFKLDTPDILKTIDTVIQRGFFRRGHVKCVLYASRDLINWFVVRTSSNHFLRRFSGTSYKYFRVALICSLAADEDISGCTVQFTPKQTNRPR